MTACVASLFACSGAGNPAPVPGAPSAKKSVDDATIGTPAPVPTPVRAPVRTLAPFPIGAPVRRPGPAPMPSELPTPAFNDWATYGFDDARDGYNPNTAQFTPPSLRRLHLAWSKQLGEFNTQTQPILATNVGGRAGTLIVGGAGGTVFGLDALTGSQVWSHRFGYAQFSCGGGTAELGVGGSAVFDPSSGYAYIVSNTNGGNLQPISVLVNKIDVATGNVAGSVNITPSLMPGELNFGHTSLTLAGGKIYAGTGSTCDISPWRGRIAAVNVKLFELESTFYTSYGRGANYSGGGVWGWGGPSVDAAGNVYATVGNTDVREGSSGPQAPFAQTSDETSGLGDHIVEIAPNLSTVIASNDPGFAFGGAAVDLDFVGSPVLAQPLGCGAVVAAQGKSGDLYVYGGINAGPIGIAQYSPATYASHNFGNPAFSPLTGLLYVPVADGLEPATPGPGMAAMRICNGSVTQVWAAAFGASSSASHAPRSMPTVTAGGVVFLGTPCRLDTRGGCTGTAGFGGALWAVDASSGAVLNGGRPIVTTPHHLRMGAVVDGDWLYLIDNGGSMYGFTLDPKYAEVKTVVPLRGNPVPDVQMYQRADR